ncbi:unnamed protein product [Somion occarium]|uniref:Uncharacterized protein n=1 Tax=Somion occarium TaxID=3059160 RepID=A0ABP1E1B0_9APHY
MATDNSPRSTEKLTIEDDDESSYENVKHEAEAAQSPTTPTASRRSKAKSFMGGFVNGLRSIPRAVTHSQFYDRGISSRCSSQGMTTGSEMQYKFAHQHYGEPIFLSPSNMPYPPRSAPPATTASEYSREYYRSGDSISSRIGGFLSDLSSLPWISTRVAIDYIPGESQGHAGQYKSSSSWYSVEPPSTPSVVSDKWRLVPDPWFPPQNLPPTEEVPEPTEHGEGAGGSNAQVEEPEEMKQLREDVQTKAREVNDLQQIVEHQKKHIAALEEEVEKLREAQAEAASSADIHRRRSSTRKSLYRKRDSVRTVTSLRASKSVSRPPSFYD